MSGIKVIFGDIRIILEMRRIYTMIASPEIWRLKNIQTNGVTTGQYEEVKNQISVFLQFFLYFFFYSILFSSCLFFLFFLSPIFLSSFLSLFSLSFTSFTSYLWLEKRNGKEDSFGPSLVKEKKLERKNQTMKIFLL